MTTLFDSTRPVKSPRHFAAGLSAERRKPYTAEDLEWTAQELNRNARDYDVVSPGESLRSDRQREGELSHR